jgi:hypothetical protein
MPRPTLAQFCTGTLTIVVTTVVLLAVSGATGVPAVAALVAVAVALGVLVTLLLMTADRRRAATSPASGRPGTEPRPTARPAVPEYGRRP